MKVVTKKIVHTPIGNIITHKSLGGTETHKRTGLLGFFDLIKAIKDEKDKKKSFTVTSKNMKDLGKYKRPSAAKIYKRTGPMVIGKKFAIPQPPNGKRVAYKQLCLRKVKNKNQAYFAPVGTCLN